MVIKSFEEIISWQRAQELAVRVCETFSGLHDFEFVNQIRRAAVSISNNISEGFERGSDTVFVRMLYIATGSAGEVRSMVYLAFQLHYSNEEQKAEMLGRCNEIYKLFAALIRIINTRVQTRGTGQTPQPRLTTND